MIRVRKTDAPDELETCGYKHDNVNRQILIDQDDKCYLCERECTTDYEVEHLFSQSHDKNLKNIWGNLYVACGYCNKRKNSKYDNIVHPDITNVEEEIVQMIDTATNFAIFEASTTNPSTELTETIKLLERLYNGENGKRKLREDRFWNAIKANYSSFWKHINNYLKDKTESNRNKILNDLSIESECLGFKYHIIKNNPVLRGEFLSACSWNRV